MLLLFNTLVFACPRSGKNSLLVEDFAGKDLLPVVVQFMAVPCDGQFAELSQTSTHMVGNTSVEILKSFDGGNVENHFNISMVACGGHGPFESHWGVHFHYRYNHVRYTLGTVDHR